jgi:hypothetical protein
MVANPSPDSAATLSHVYTMTVDIDASIQPRAVAGETSSPVAIKSCTRKNLKKLLLQPLLVKTYHNQPRFIPKSTTKGSCMPGSQPIYPKGGCSSPHDGAWHGDGRFSVEYLASWESASAQSLQQPSSIVDMAPTGDLCQ